MDCRDDNSAIAKAKFIATQIAIDTPQLDQRHVAVLNDAGAEIFQAPIRSKPPISWGHFGYSMVLTFDWWSGPNLLKAGDVVSKRRALWATQYSRMAIE
jgi:hypothetical protein